MYYILVDKYLKKNLKKKKKTKYNTLSKRVFSVDRFERKSCCDISRLYIFLYLNYFFMRV